MKLLEFHPKSCHIRRKFNREIDRISYCGFTMFQMNTTTLINTLRAPLSNWDSNPDRLVSTSGQRNGPDELLRIYDNMNA
ncbi:unnamed protein product [Sphenostylis stenocarpa]|uniref:Uncharacterized protein n=1 Tax=Sphenostylis stenocarpa TaxID=92480 RepID=A0AA86S158_9FABA|nr:unnamed protein product [Sphenostylis stenocarpa]